MSRRAYTKGQKVKNGIFWICCIAAVGIAAAVIWFVGFTLKLKTEYKKTAQEINDAFLKSGPGGTTVSQDGVTLPASQELIDYYDSFLLFNKTVVFNKKTAEANKESITFNIGGKTLRFTGLEDGSAIHICWTVSGEEKNYTVRSQITFMQLNSYMQNYKRKVEKAEKS